ncbi:hypothetical protein ACFQVA_31465 [Actinomadura keratinilytica]
MDRAADDRAPQRVLPQRPDARPPGLPRHLLTVAAAPPSSSRCSAGWSPPRRPRSPPTAPSASPNAAAAPASPPPSWSCWSPPSTCSAAGTPSAAAGCGARRLSASSTRSPNCSRNPTPPRPPAGFTASPPSSPNWLSWMSYDVGLQPTAQKYFVLALHAAKEADDKPLGSYVLSHMSRR